MQSVSSTKPLPHGHLGKVVTSLMALGDPGKKVETAQPFMTGKAHGVPSMGL